MRDLQNRCEKVVELEIQLDEIKEQYNNVIRNSNSKAQQKKMAFLERNLEQLTLVQKQVERCLSWPPVLPSDTFCTSSSIRILRSRKRLGLPNESCSQEMSGYRISKRYFKMPTAGLPCRIRSLKLSFRLSGTDWTKREVQYFHKSGSASTPNSEFFFFFQRKRAQFPPHSVSQAESRNLYVVVAVAGLCRVRRPRHLLLQLSPLTHFQGSRMRKGTL